MLLCLPPCPSFAPGTRRSPRPLQTAPRGCLRAGLSPTGDPGSPQAALSNQCWARSGMPSTQPLGPGVALGKLRPHPTRPGLGMRWRSRSSCSASVAAWLPVTTWSAGTHSRPQVPAAPTLALQPPGPQAAGWTSGCLRGSPRSLTPKLPLLAEPACAQDQPQSSGPR